MIFKIEFDQDCNFEILTDNTEAILITFQDNDNTFKLNIDNTADD